ncbi:MAG: hypothetical protein M1400_00140 [Patescibacteria group bacterium]|nr:hypothetical protein [Patescibacteria group bacterium]
MAWMHEDGQAINTQVLEREPQVRKDLKPAAGPQGGTEEPSPQSEDIRPQSSRYLAG